jgi:parallel beta-helix repeat protein
MVKTDPNESLKSLEICMTLKPETSGLNELKANIKKKIAADKARSNEEKAKAKARELKKLRTKIYTQIKKNKMPEAIADIVKQIGELKEQHPKSDASKKLEKHLKNRIYNEFDRKKRKNPEKALQIIETALKHYPNDQKAQKLQSDLQANMEKALANAKLEKQKTPHLKAIRSFIKKPTKNIAHAIKAHLHQLKQIDPKEDTKEHLSQIIKKLDQKAINSNTIDKASDYLEARQILQPAPNYNLNYELTSLTNKKVKHIIDFANNHKISKDIKPIKERLELLENWNANNKKEFFIHALIQNYKQNILKEAGNDKQKALEYLTALYEIPGLSSDNVLMGLEKSLRAGTTQQPISPDSKPASPATNPLVTKLKQNADLIITRKVIFEQSGKLFSIIDNLNKLGKSNEAQSYKQKASESLLKTATRLINTKDLANAQKYIILAKQFSPESENAQKLQIKLTKAKNEAKKNQPLVVGPGGYSTIAQAIKAAPEGATITIKPGTYKESIKLTKRITLKGASPASCFIQSNKGPALVVSSNATVSGLTFSNKSPVQSSTIFIPKGSPKISYCEITNDTPAKPPQWSAAIEIGGGSPTINKCTIKEAKGMGIIITGGSPTIKNNTVRNCSIYGVWFNGSCSAKLLNNTVIGNLKSGVGVKNNANPTISGNQISNSGENGILIYSNGKGTYNNNKVSSNKLSGIDVWEAQPAAISGNSINNNKKDGIQVRGNKTVAKIGKNTIQGNRGKDIRKISGKIIPF